MLGKHYKNVEFFIKILVKQSESYSTFKTLKWILQITQRFFFFKKVKKTPQTNKTKTPTIAISILK